MKLQTKVQKIVCLIVLMTSALSFFISLGLATDLSVLKKAKIYRIAGNELFTTIQPFNRLLVRITIGLIVLAIFLFITRTHLRRRYYISNYIAISIVVLANIGTSIWAILTIVDFRNQFLNNVDFEGWREVIELYDPTFPYTESTFWLDFNIVARVLVILATLLLFVNLIWKISLMKYEDKLLSGKIKPENIPTPKEVESC